MNRLLSYCLILGVLSANAQLGDFPPVQELEPVENALTDLHSEYKLHLRKVMFDKALQRSAFQFLRQPSFQPESLLSVELVDNAYIAQVIYPSESIWPYKGDQIVPKVSITEKILPYSLAEHACLLWHKMLVRTKFQKRNISADGISYTFLGFDPGYGFMTAISRTPEEGTKPYLLAEIGLQIMNYVMASTNEDSTIETQTFDLIMKLEKALEAEEASNMRLQEDSRSGSP